MYVKLLSCTQRHTQVEDECTAPYMPHVALASLSLLPINFTEARWVCEESIIHVEAGREPSTSTGGMTQMEARLLPRIASGVPTTSLARRSGETFLNIVGDAEGSHMYSSLGFSCGG